MLEGYEYIDDLSGSYAKFSTCFRMKIQDDDNDDGSEGNSYFYNGKYYAQYETYAAFRLCSSDDCSSDKCDLSTGYVTDLQTYLQANVAFVQNYCNACDNMCGRRSLEDAGDDDDAAAQVVVNCDTCQNECSNLGSGNGYDEADYLDCQASPRMNGYYQAPSCDEGKLVMSLFHDEDCTVKSHTDLDMDFNYNTFGTVQNMCAGCYGNDDVCADLYEDSTHCYGNKAMAGDGDNNVCKRYHSTRERTYAKSKSKFPVTGFLVTFVILGCAACFVSHTYYIRHTQMKDGKRQTLITGEMVSGNMASGGTQELPPVS